MAEIVSYIIAILSCVYVLLPLFRSAELKHPAKNQLSFSELPHRKPLIDETTNDLIFDYQTGKLSEEDYAVLIKEQEQLLKETEHRLQERSKSDIGQLEKKLEAEIAAFIPKLANKAMCPE